MLLFFLSWGEVVTKVPYWCRGLGRVRGLLGFLALSLLGRGFLLGFLILQYMFDDNDSIDCKLHAFCYTMMRGYSGNRLLLNP